MKKFSSSQFETIVKAGGGIAIPAAQLSASQFKALAGKLKGNAVLHIVDIGERFNATELAGIAGEANAPAYVAFS